MSLYQTWNEEDYSSSSDEARNDRVRRTRDRHTNSNLERVRTAVSSPDSLNRAYVAALNTIREDPLVRAQLQRIEEIWTVKKDKVLADVLYTEVTLAIVQAASAIAVAGQNREGLDEEQFAAVQSARSRTVGNFIWAEGVTAQPRDADEARLEFARFKITAGR